MQFTRRGTFQFLIALAMATLVISGTSCNSSWRTSIAPSNATIPQGWKSIDFRSFALSMPPTMSGKEERGTDLAVCVYRGGGMVLEIESGFTPDDLRFDANEIGYSDTIVDVDGRKAKIATYQLRDSNTGDFPNAGKHIAAIHFPNVDAFGTKMTMWAYCDDSARQELAKQIFRTTRFK